MEGRLLLSTSARHTELRQIYHQPLGFAAARPDTPVLPYGSISSKATFIDTTVRITNGEHVVVGGGTYIAPYATLNAASGFIKIGTHSTIQDNATIISNPNHAVRTTNVQIGDNVVIGFGAVVKGPSKIGAFNTRSSPSAGSPTEIGANAVIDGGAVIRPGAIVGALAHVSGVVVPSTSRVLPGASVTTNADLSNPAKVVPVGTVVDTPTSEITATLANTALLASGYTTLYQGNSATGVSPGPIGTPVTGVNNGNLSAVEGASASPANTNNQLPRFLSSFGELVPLTTGTTLFNFTARVIGNAVFNARPMDVQNHLGRSNSIRADLLPNSTISFGSAPQTGTGVTIAEATPAGALPIGQNLLVGDHAVILGGSTIPAGSTTPASFGNNVTIGSGAVVNDSKIGNGATIGNRAYIFQSTIPDNATIPDGEILIRNVPRGFVQS
jgi:carbonic anhydrase/acetyltransferase-like protein (isoleucine patch superfamily)